MTASTEAVGSSGSTRGSNPLARFFLLKSELEQARHRQFGVSDQGWVEYVWARSAYDAADRYREVAGDRRATVLLLEQAMWLAAVATARRAHGPEAKLDADSLLQAVSHSDSVKRSVEALSEAERAHLVRTLSERRAAAATATADPSSQDLRAQIQWLRPLAGQVLTPLDQDADATQHVKRQRIARIASSALLVLGFLAILSYGLARVLAPVPVNYALNKPVTFSSIEGTKDNPPQGLVDGITTSVGAVTRRSSNPWLQIDLGTPTPIQRVVVHNAASDKLQTRGLPLIVEASNDGRKWKRLGLRKQPFSVWKLVPKRTTNPFRYVRLRVKARRGQLRLSEVAVH